MQKLLIFILIIANSYYVKSQTISTDEMIQKAHLQGFENAYPIAYPINSIYYFNEETAIDLVLIEIQDCINGKYSIEYPYYAESLSRYCKYNQKLGEGLFSYYIKTFSRSITHVEPDLSFLVNYTVTDDLLCALLKHQPKGLKDTLYHDLKYLYHIAMDNHPAKNSFFENFLLFFANGFNTHIDHQRSVICFLLIADALKKLESDNKDISKKIEDMTKDLDLDYIPSYSYTTLRCSDFYEKSNLQDTVIVLSQEYNSIEEIVNSDTILKREILKDVKCEISRPVIVFKNEALISYEELESGSNIFIKLVLADKKKARIKILTHGPIV